MADFLTADKKTMGNEGGVNFNPDDKGNVVVNGVAVLPTYKGIAPSFWPNWRGWQGVQAAMQEMVKMPKYGTSAYYEWAKYLNKRLADSPMLQRYVLEFYEVNFWTANRLGEIISQAVAEWIYDHVVNGGNRGVMWIQEAAGVTADGGMGPISLKAINAADPVALLEKAKQIAAAYRLEKVRKDPTQKQFLHSWLSRDGLTEEEIKTAIATV